MALSLDFQEDRAGAEAVITEAGELALLCKVTMVQTQETKGAAVAEALEVLPAAELVALGNLAASLAPQSYTLKVGKVAHMLVRMEIP